MEEDIKIIKKHYVFTTNHVLDDENKQFKQAIENLINKYKELRQLMLDKRNLYHEQIAKAEKEIKRLRDKIDNLEMNNTEYERQKKESDKNMVATLEEALRYCFQIKVLEEQNKEHEDFEKFLVGYILDVDEIGFSDCNGCKNTRSFCSGEKERNKCIECRIEYFKKNVRGESNENI